MVGLVVVTPRIASAQVTPAAGYVPPDDTPRIGVGVTIYADYTYQSSPQTNDTDGNAINPSSFNVSRSYINITGQVNHIVAFRITPDVVRESGLITLATGNTISNDSLIFRIKYAFAQFNLDDWMTRGSWVRLGIQQTPLLDYEEGIYRYRFQGTTFTEREGYYNSADAGASFHYNFAKNFGDIHVGVYNGEGYARPEVNDQKAIEIRGTVRPFATSTPVLRGLRFTGFYFGDNYIKNSERTRGVFQVTYEHPYINAGYDYLDTHDQINKISFDVQGKGWSFWLTPRKPLEGGASIEALIRYDHNSPDQRTSQVRPRTIVGAAYWFKHQGNGAAALLLDYDGQTFENYATPQSSQKRIALHGLINF